MNRNLFSRIILSLVALLVVTACSTVPITGRKQLTIIPVSEMQALSFQQYDEVIAGSRLSSDAEATARIKRVGGRIQGAVERYFREKNLSGQLDGYDWEFNLIEAHY